MELPLVLLRLVLAGVFAYAAFEKLRDRDGTRQNLVDFGVPERLAPAGAWLLPLAELSAALALIPPATALIGALAALALLAIFVAAIGANLLLGRRPSCSCFGARHASPISYRMLVRNGILAGVAAFVAVVEPGPVQAAFLAVSPFELALTGIGLLLVAMAAAQSLLLLRVFRQNGLLLKQLSRMAAAAKAEESRSNVKAAGFTTIAAALAGLPPGTPAPDFTLKSLDGKDVSLLSRLPPDKPLVLVFGDPGCGPCRAVMPDVRLWHRQHAAAFDFLLISSGPGDANRAKFPDLPADRILLQKDREAANAFGAVGTPSAVLVLPDGTIGGPLANAEAEIRRLIRSLARAHAPDTVDDRAPTFTLPDLEGRDVSLEQFRGKPLLLFFSGRNCGLCKRVLPEVRAWESRPLAERPALVVVSGASKDESRKLDLSSTIVLEEEPVLRKQYELTGTPAAALVDAAGYIVKKGAGQAAIRGLLDTTSSEGGRSSALQSSGAERPETPATQFESITTPAKHSCVIDEWLEDGSIVLHNSCRNRVMTLNATAALIWECCDGTHTVEDIAAEFRDVFPAAEGVENQIRDVLEGLLRDDMITAGRISPETAAAV